MVRAVRTSLPARLAAVWIALVLSGAPAVAAHPEAGEHHCQCKAHGRDHECECARCHRPAPAQRDAAEAEAVPPCHRALVKDAVAADRTPPRSLAGRSCISGYCGGAEQRATPLTPLGPFTLPDALAEAGVLPPAGRFERPPGTQRDAPSVPETPPPRADRAPASRA